MYYASLHIYLGRFLQEAHGKACDPHILSVARYPNDYRLTIRKGPLMGELKARQWLRALRTAGAAMMLTGIAASGAMAESKLTAVMHSGMRVLDPVITTAHITRNHAYMIYDTLLGIDESYKPKPQMADWKISEDGLTYTFTLRDGLKLHDGAPVTAEDCVASLKRWAKKRRRRPDDDGLHRQPGGDRRQDLHAEAEGAVLLRAGAIVEALRAARLS